MEIGTVGQTYDRIIKRSISWSMFPYYLIRTHNQQISLTSFSETRSKDKPPHSHFQVLNGPSKLLLTPNVALEIPINARRDKVVLFFKM